MFVTPTRLQTLGAALIATCALGACDDPVAHTDLRPEGPPDVLAVLVFDDTSTATVESATYCKPNDPKRPGNVGIPFQGLNPTICPLDGTQVSELTDAFPNGWYVRVMFDELLDPDIETLEPVLDAMGNPTDTANGSLATTQPVKLRCQDVTGAMADVDYDGYYSPSGNAVTWPLGPSLVIKPLDPTIVPVESECELTLKDIIKDKDGNSVTADDQKPFKFKLAPVTITGVSPGDGDAIDPFVGGVELDFNVDVDTSDTFCTTADAAPCAGDTTRIFDLQDTTAMAPASNANIDNSDGTLIFVGADLLGGHTYSLKVPQGFKMKDKCGKQSEVAGIPAPFSFDTNPAKFVSFNPGGGSAVNPSKKIVVTFNQFIDLATFTDGVDFDLTPKPANFSLGSLAGGRQIQFKGDYNLNTKYTLTIKAGAQISDIYGKQTITFDADKVAEFTTAPAISITAQSPANGAKVVKAPTASGKITLTFNQEMVAASLDPSEFQLAKADGTPVAIAPAVTASGAGVSVSYPALPAGSYKFTLKQGATLNDKIVPANTYTQAADRVISFTIADSPPAGPAFKCLGQ